jgi:hypothetical protein
LSTVAHLDALAELREKGEYFFWNGNSALKTATGLAWRTISRMLARASVKGIHTAFVIPSPSACLRSANSSAPFNSS